MVNPLSWVWRTFLGLGRPIVEWEIVKFVGLSHTTVWDWDVTSTVYVCGRPVKSRKRGYNREKRGRLQNRREDCLSRDLKKAGE